MKSSLQQKVRASEQIFENGDRVFYKREGRDRWLGPGKVVFQDGKVVFVRHGGVFVRVSPIGSAKCAEDGLADKRAPKQYSSECTDKMDNTVRIRIHTSS